MNIEATEKELVFIAGYFEALRFTEDRNGQLDESFNRESVIDCLSFFSRISCYLSDDEIGKAGRDFWLTRNGEGAGFWDGGWIMYGSMFDRIAQGYDEVSAMYEDGI